MSCGWHSPSFIPVRFSWSGKERQAFHELPGVTETQQDVVGLLGTEAFLGPPFLDHRKWASFSLQDLPWIPKVRSRQLEKGGGAETRQAQSRNSAALERRPGFPSGDTHESALELLCSWKPIRWEKLTARCLQAQTPQEEPAGWWYRLPVSPPPTNQVHQRPRSPLWAITTKTPHYPFEVGTYSFEGTTKFCHGLVEAVSEADHRGGGTPVPSKHLPPPRLGEQLCLLPWEMPRATEELSMWQVSWQDLTLPPWWRGPCWESPHPTGSHTHPPPPVSLLAGPRAEQHKGLITPCPCLLLLCLNDFPWSPGESGSKINEGFKQAAGLFLISGWNFRTLKWWVAGPEPAEGLSLHRQDEKWTQK